MKKLFMMSLGFFLVCGAGNEALSADKIISSLKSVLSGPLKNAKEGLGKSQLTLCKKADAGGGIFSIRSFNGIGGTIKPIAAIGIILCSGVPTNTPAGDLLENFEGSGFVKNAKGTFGLKSNASMLDLQGAITKWIDANKNDKKVKVIAYIAKLRKPNTLGSIQASPVVQTAQEPNDAEIAALG